MSIPRTFYDWKVEAFESSPEGHDLARIPGVPTVVMRSGEEWVVTQGSPEADLNVVYQRAAIAACDREVALATKTDDVRVWTQRRMEADVAERKAMRDRLDDLERRAANDLVVLPPRVVVPVPPVAVKEESMGQRVLRRLRGE